MARTISSFPGQRDSTHSIRTSQTLWAAARTRADQDGITMNAMLNEFLEGYARYQLNLPRVTKVYTDPKPATENIPAQNA